MRAASLTVTWCSGMAGIVSWGAQGTQAGGLRGQRTALDVLPSAQSTPFNQACWEYHPPGVRRGQAAS